MKPKRIILVRHGQSESNALGFAVKETVPNYKVDITALGVEQANRVGQELKSIIGLETVFFYVSPFLRAKNTYLQLSQYFVNNVTTMREEVLIRERETGNFKSITECKRDLKIKESYGDFYYRPTNAESTADLYLRINIFFDKLFRNFEKPEYPENVIIVTHSLTIRAFLMRWFHLEVEQFESLARPKNCGIYIFDLKDGNKYLLTQGLFSRNGTPIPH